MYYLIISFIAWIIAQCLKHVARLFGRNRRIFSSSSRSNLLLSGGMPSAQSATVVSLAVSIGLYEGWNSAIFALATLFAAVVIYDATMVRYSSGQQGDMINRLISKQYTNIKPLRVAHGHTVLEVTAGAIIGALVAIVAFFTTQ